eukprot:524378-Hanusia_phi.AAC.16
MGDKLGGVVQWLELSGWICRDTKGWEFQGGSRQKVGGDVSKGGYCEGGREPGLRGGNRGGIGRAIERVEERERSRGTFEGDSDRQRSGLELRPQLRPGLKSRPKGNPLFHSSTNPGIGLRAR